MKPTWIFDLDNTLHDAEPYIFPEMNRQMTRYVATHLDISETEADALRIRYWRQYGSTLAGLLHHGHLDPEHFLRKTHEFPDLARKLTPMRALRQTLAKLPGRKVLFTNAPLDYAVSVLRALRIDHLFVGVIAMQQTGFRPKPHLAGYLGLLRRYRLDPTHCIMVEDTRHNLVTAKRLGMRTVWLSRKLNAGPAVDVRISRFNTLRQRMRHLV